VIFRIHANPKFFPNYGSGLQRCVLRRLPHVVVYRITGDVIEIVAVAHGHRRTGYWRLRN